MKRYKWTSNKGGSGTSRVILEGTKANPKRQMVRGEEADLTEEEYEKYSKRGFRLREVDGSNVDESDEGDQQTPSPGATNPQGASAAGRGRAARSE